MSTKKILAITGIRSDYDLMSGLYKKLNNDDEIDLELLVTGAHLSSSYGYTVKNIKDDELNILVKIESLIDSNSRASRLKTLSIILQNSIDVVKHYNPDLIIYPGDREEVMVGALLGAYLRIPTIHFFGGDHSSDGNVDNILRHSTSKLSSVHFVANKQHKRRLVKIGEPKKRIFVVGSPALDKFNKIESIKKNKILNNFDKSSWDDYALVIYHPILGYDKKAGENFKNILQSLKELNIKAFVSYPNTDPGNKDIISTIDKYKNDENFYFYKNLNRNIFVNLMRNASFMIGNSSAGIIEAPMIPLGVINVGERQKGRLAANNVIFTENGKKKIKQSINKVLSEKFEKKLSKIKSPYGKGNSINKAYNLIKSLDFQNFIKKSEDPL